MIILIVFMVLFLLGLLLLSGYIFNEARKKLQESKENLQQAENIKIKKHTEELKNLENIKYAQNHEKDILKDIQKEQQVAQINLNNLKGAIQVSQKDLEDWRNECEKQAAMTKGLLEEKYANYIRSYGQQLEDAYSAIETQFDTRKSKLQEEYDQAEEEYRKLKDSLSAAAQAKLREKEKEDNVSFYKLSVSEDDLQDIEKLIGIRPFLHQPVILNKLIWSTYFQKQTTEMCNRILGVNPVCGIYKITNLITGEAYVGQSVNIADRWKQHVKCGLDIDASATNKLYNNMKKYNVWNFTFELLEKCTRDQLDEKEKFFINLYQTDKFGMNGTRGNG